MASYLNGVVMHFFLTLLIAVSLRATHLTVQDIAKHGRNLIIKPPEGTYQNNTPLVADDRDRIWEGSKWYATTPSPDAHPAPGARPADVAKQAGMRNHISSHSLLKNKMRRHTRSASRNL